MTRWGDLAAVGPHWPAVDQGWVVSGPWLQVNEVFLFLSHYLVPKFLNVFSDELRVARRAKFCRELKLSLSSVKKIILCIITEKQRKTYLDLFTSFPVVSCFTNDLGQSVNV